MTTSELIAHLSEYPADTPIVDGKGYELKWPDVSERELDLDGEPVPPSTGIAVSIGRRF